MKKSIFFLMFVAMLVMISGCSLFKDTSVSKTQDDNVITTDNPDTIAAEVQEPTNTGDSTQMAGTTESNVKTIKITLYFATEDNSAVKKEIRDVQVKDGAILKASVQALIDGPQTAGLHKTIPDGTVIRGVNLKNKVAIVDFSKEFSSANGIAEVVKRISAVNTLTGIQGVEKVKILVEGKDLTGPSGKPYGEMGPAALDSDGLPIPGEMKILILYFGNSNADKVVAEKREVEITKGESVEKTIFLELMKGSVNKGLYPVIPQGTRILSVKTKDGICTLDLSSEFVDNHPGGTAGESMTLNSIVCSLTELSNVKKVQFLIDGQKRESYTHAVFDQPFERNADMIGKE